MIRRQHREDKNLPLSAACTSAYPSPGSPALWRCIDKGRTDAVVIFSWSFRFGSDGLFVLETWPKPFIGSPNRSH